MVWLRPSTKPRGFSPGGYFFLNPRTISGNFGKIAEYFSHNL